MSRACEGVLDAANTLVDDLWQLRVRVGLDDRLEISLGTRIVDHELRWLPLRIELGPRDVAARQAVVARRARKSKETLALRDLVRRVPRMLDDD